MAGAHARIASTRKSATADRALSWNDRCDGGAVPQFRGDASEKLRFLQEPRRGCLLVDHV